MPKHCPKIIKLFVPFLSLVFILAATIKPATAQSSIYKLTVSPPHHDIEAKPGETVQQTVKITNPNDAETAVTVKTLIYDFIVGDDAGTPQKVSIEEAGRYVASPWITPDKTEFVLEPGTEQLVTFVITVPSDALPGGHYAGAFFEPTLGKGPSTTQSLTTPQVGSLFAINIAGDINYDTSIKEFKVGTRLYEYGPVDFSATVQNLSDTHIRPQVSILITDMLGRKMTTLALDEVNIFPFKARSYETQWDQVWGLGRYAATLQVPYGPNGNVAEATIFFWILPYKLIMAVLVIILTLIAIFIITRRHLHHRNDQRDSEIDALKRRISELENDSNHHQY